MRRVNKFILTDDGNLSWIPYFPNPTPSIRDGDKVSLGHEVDQYLKREKDMQQQQSPGQQSPGRQSPGLQSPGRHSSGQQSPGRQHQRNPPPRNHEGVAGSGSQKINPRHGEENAIIYS